MDEIERIMNMIREAERDYKTLYLVECTPITFAKIISNDVFMTVGFCNAERGHDYIVFSGVKIQTTWYVEDNMMMGYMR